MAIRLVRDDEERIAIPPVRVLLVAEQVIIGALLGALVELAGYDPCYANPGEAAADAIRRLDPAIVLIDVRHGAAHDGRVRARARRGGTALRYFGHHSDRMRIEAATSRWGEDQVIELPPDYRALERYLDDAIDAGRDERGRA
jgi:DNA-binding NtrC family response regulator